MVVHANSSMASIALRILGLMRAVTDQRTPSRTQRVDQRVVPEPGVGPYCQWAAGAGPADPGGQLLDEPFDAPLGGSLAQPRMQHLTGLGPCRQKRVVAQHFGVAVGGTVLML